ncbi:FHA domain-containing protein [Paenibacillus rhizovicinus]|uniref:FHA domain-containing protein n=1 Tax=Paenibacillus rhizovicinus TaxID=2704463 RepID=A0A6C0P3T7_9BACL|nr:DUF6382 domain-containing protein [Paenibacillus rhizovicinus]QHW33220.1 FHA domain-containing protein [Paenibacillus rhizovicinus]
MMMDELRVDFAMKRGHEMIVDLKSGVTREQLDSIEIQMLQGQRIPKLLPMEWIDIDGCITFRYPLNGKRMLMHRLQTQRMTMFDFYTLLLTVVEALDDCRHYMLRADCFLLHEQYIFIGDHWDDAVLAYVPLREQRAVSSAGEAVLAMAIRWVGDIDEPDGIGLQQVFQHLRGEHVSWDQLRQTLLALLGASLKIVAVGEVQSGEAARGEKAAATKEQAASASPPSLRLEGVSIPFEQTQADRSVIHHERVPVEQGWDSLKIAGRSDQAREVDLPLTEIQEQTKGSSRTGWMIGAGAVLVTAIIWRFLYLAAPTQTNMLLSSGLTLMIGAIGLIALRRVKERDMAGERSEEAHTGWSGGGKEWAADDDFVPNSVVLGAGGSERLAGRTSESAAAWDNRRLDARQNPGNEARQEAYQSQRQAPQQERGVVDSPNSGGVSFKPQSIMPLKANDATVLLGQEAKETPDEKSHLPWLERQTEGQAEKIRLEQRQFIIGRSNEGTHYMDQASGISRAHMELVASDGRWSAKDMGSRNGSKLNGNAMVPYKTYDLADTDELQLAGDQGPVYIFRAG